MKWMGKKVAVLYGGRSTEREVSLKTGQGCADALKSKGYDVSLVDVGLEVAANLRQLRIDVAFIALHGRFGEDGCIQGLLETMAIPYTGCGVLSSAMGMDKVVSKAIFQMHGLTLAAHRIFPKASAPSIKLGDVPFPLPVVVKPAGEGSSVGVHIVKDPSALTAACVDAAQYQGDIVIEAFVKGKEIAVGVLDDKALGAIEIVPAREFYDYAAKYTAGTTEYFFPARIPEGHARLLAEAAVRAHKSLRCEGATRVDFILTDDGKPYLLEVNTLPGMTPTSLIPKIAAGNGISFAELCERLLEGASLKA